MKKFDASDWKDLTKVERIKLRIKHLQEEEEKLKKELKKESKPKKKKKQKTITRKESYYDDLTNPLWFKKRASILERDKHQCKLCGSKDNLHVHHLKYVDGRHAWEYPNKNLITLCQDCHEKVHADKNNPLNPYKKPITNKC